MRYRLQSPTGPVNTSTMKCRRREEDSTSLITLSACSGPWPPFPFPQTSRPFVQCHVAHLFEGPRGEVATPSGMTTTRELGCGTLDA